MPLPSTTPVAATLAAPATPAATPPATPAAAALAAMSDALRALVERGETRRYRKGTLLIQEGDVGDTLFIILSGRLRAFSSGDNDREITYGVYGAGEYLGEMSLDGGPRSASVITLETSTCAVVGRRTLERFIAERPEFAFELLAKVIRRARVATLNARQLALNDVYGRLKALLVSLVVAGDDTPKRAERLTHLEMAHRLGCSREMVSRLMKDLERGGYLQVQDHHFLLLKPLPQRW
jgi:CRP/FNR family cyclic AMP-dependent transcriptional regulator